MRPTGALGADALLAFGTVANILAPELSRADQMRQLEGEVERRTRQLDDEKGFTEQIVDSLPVGLYVIDREYRVKAWNRKRETGMQGISREQALGRTIFEILHRAPAESLRREFDEVFRTGRIQQFNIESRASGELRMFRITKIPMRVSDAAHHPRDHHRRGRHRLDGRAGSLRAVGEARRDRPARGRRDARGEQPARHDLRLRRVAGVAAG